MTERELEKAAILKAKEGKRRIQLGLLVPGGTISLAVAIRILMEIWTQLPNLTGERLTGYCAVLLAACIAWLVISHIFLEVWYDRG